MRLSVVIVNYKVRDYLEQCLDSLVKALDGTESEVIVVDNASGDGSVEYLRSRYSEAIYIESDENMGFARANNMAFARCTGDLILMLNPDTVVSRCAIAGCMNFIDSHDDAGAVTVKMISATGAFHVESKRGFPSPASSFFKLTGLSRLFPRSRVFGSYNLLYLDEDGEHRVDIFCGAYIMFRRSLMEKAGMLDPAFFMYGEDIDFSFRLTKRTGYGNYYLPLPIIHYKGESTKRSSMAYVRAFYGAMLIFYKKYYGSAHSVMQLIVKAGVVLHGAGLYVVQNVKRLLHRGGEAYRPVRLTVMLVGFGCDDMVDLAELARRNGRTLDVQCSVNADGLHSLTPIGVKCDYVVFCREEVSYDDIITFMNKCAGKGAELGIYSRNLHSLVTSQEVMH